MASAVPSRPITGRPLLDGRERTLVGLDGLLAVGAAGGAVGLISGSLDASTFEHRLPLHSPVLGGVALALVVAVPAIVALVATIACRPWAPAAQITAGALLVGWIAVQVVVIGPTSVLQPLMFAWGCALLALGALERRAQPRA
jgi:hypothetical protein